jgi:hypothetical protein
MKYRKLNSQKTKNIFISPTNEVHPGEQQFYRLPVNGGKSERITTMTGGNEVTISPDENILRSVIRIQTNHGNCIYKKTNPAVK